MSRISGRFTQTPEEARRYILNYALTLSQGETVVSIVANSITQVFGKTTIEPFVINNIIIGPGNTQVVYFASGGDDQTDYEVQFLATTSVGQIIEDVVYYSIRSDL
jgi:hypothetical protein